MKLGSRDMVEIKCLFMSRFLGAEFLKGEICTVHYCTGLYYTGKYSTGTYEYFVVLYILFCVRDTVVLYTVVS